jgi:hypothetical protein
MKKWFKIGFVIGFVGSFVSTLGLLFGPVERVGNIFLWPTRTVLNPVNEYFATLPGLINILVFAGVTGVIYGCLLYIVSLPFKGKAPLAP